MAYSSGARSGEEIGSLGELEMWVIEKFALEMRLQCVSMYHCGIHILYVHLGIVDASVKAKD